MKMLRLNEKKGTDLSFSVLILLCLLRLCLTFTVGFSFFNLTNVILFGGIAVCYYCVLKKKYCSCFFGANIFFLFCNIVMVALSNVFSTTPEYKSTASLYTKHLLVLLLIWGIYVYLTNVKLRTLKIYLFVYLFSVAISSCYTSFVALNSSNEEVIRATAYGVYDSSFPLVYGGFDFVYALVIIYTAVLISAKFAWDKIALYGKIVVIILELIFSFTVIVASYGTAFTLIFIFTLWQLLPKGYIRILVIMIFVSVVYFTPQIITKFVESIPYIPELTSSRLNELILSLSGRGSSGYITDDGQRIDRIRWSLEVFFENPVFGGVVNDTQLTFGYHTEWIDQLARYGFVTALFNSAFWLFTYKKIKSNAIAYDKTNVSYKCVKNCFVMFLILGFLDPVSMVVTACPLFVLAPFIPKFFIKESFVKSDSLSTKE